ncbi:MULTISPECIES: hypothetical protein [unclassified Cryobacterium]|uniref:hypothetical protein n=1 Tax=unclassified Cryobacterium TaxID=2649013 RepID=UPI00106CBE53|nr:MULTISPECIES: hypothetical protein [unclassified Cryobacterium]TFC54527.1 hypothetical protein E3O68_09290 [Cryobacterium sp. TMB3-1-2]TFC63057.1 hypothetical protein E3O60_00585 [Cryobacterium sp. TMB1-7]TFC70891.1 hypothetical protein E3T21_09340 [Cryobacterium sp. TMB3-15]TFC77344.1 hypothetical protein E3T22_06460 [Cryobacterium sp. TMB3-10]TFD45278.1 hypothetical protein E3T58_03085 [Cryobacterium sp. TMB3-12]
MTMVLGVCFGLVSSVVWAVVGHVINANANPGLAAPFIGLELYLAVVGGLLLSSVAVVGAAVALAIADHHLKSSRLVQGGIAGVGAALAGLGLLVYLGPTIVLDGGGAAGILVFVAAASCGLMCIRASAHKFVN